MRRACIDANVILRFLTGEPPDMAGQARQLFAAADQDQVVLLLDDIVLAETVWVLTSFYELPAAEVARVLLQLLSHEAIQADDKSLLAEALRLFSDHNVDFADALLAARMRRRGITEVFSFDRHLDRLPGITHLEPGQQTE